MEKIHSANTYAMNRSWIQIELIQLLKLWLFYYCCCMYLSSMNPTYNFFFKSFIILFVSLSNSTLSNYVAHLVCLNYEHSIEKSVCWKNYRRQPMRFFHSNQLRQFRYIYISTVRLFSCLCLLTLQPITPHGL